MPTNSLPGLPAETITEIFKFAGSFATATSLSSTSHKFHSIWITHLASICFAILVCTIPCFYQAFEYVKAQPLDAAKPNQVEDTVPLAIKITRQFCKNADIAHLAWQHYKSHVIERDYQEPPDSSSFTEAQRTCFLRAWYRIHTLASLGSDPLPYDMLAALDLLDFKHLLVALIWLMYGCRKEHRYKLGISFQNDREGPLWDLRLPKSSISSKDWKDLMTRLGSLYIDLHESLLDDRSLESIETFFGVSIHDDPSPETVETSFEVSMLQQYHLRIDAFKRTGNSISLADILPLLSERDDPDRLYNLSSRRQGR